jgi:hypothetical protein
MTDTRPTLCVGGPLDGQHLSILHGNRFVASSDLSTEYRQESFRTPEGEISIWVPAGQSQLETMAKLVQGYAPSQAGWRNTNPPGNGQTVTFDRCRDEWDRRQKI